MNLRRLPLVAAISVASLGLLGLAACGSSGNSTSSAGKTQAVSSQQTVSSQVIQIDVLTGKLSTKYGIIGPDKRGHDTFVPSEFTAKVGQTYTIKVYNYDEGAHSFTIDALKINQLIAPYIAAGQPSVTTFTVKFLATGVYRFYCKMPCDMGQGGWAMTADRNGHGHSQDGFMAGYVNVIPA